MAAIFQDIRDNLEIIRETLDRMERTRANGGKPVSKEDEMKMFENYLLNEMEEGRRRRLDELYEDF